MITGVHALFYTTDPEGARAFIRDKLRLPHYDAHEGWLIFDAPAGHIACHSSDVAKHNVSFSCDDIEATVRELRGRGVEFIHPIEEQDWGWTIEFELPGGGPVMLYQDKFLRP